MKSRKVMKHNALVDEVNIPLIYDFIFQFSDNKTNTIQIHA